MKIAPSVDWQDGILLSPGLFEQTERHLLSQAYGFYSYVQPYNWGIASLEVDHDLFQKGTLRFLRIRGITKQGVHFDLYDAGGMSSLPPSREISDLIDGFSNGVGTVDLYLAVLPGKDRGAGKLMLNGQHREEDNIAVRYPQFHVLTGKEVQEQDVPDKLKIGTLEVRDGAASYSAAYVPSCLSIGYEHSVGKKSALLGIVASIAGMMEKRVRELIGFVRKADRSDPTKRAMLAGFHMPMLSILNEGIALLRHDGTLPMVHPETMYRQLIRLLTQIGTYATYDAGSAMSEIYDVVPAYKHDDLIGCFTALKGLFNQFLAPNDIAMEEVVALPLSRQIIDSEQVLVVNLGDAQGPRAMQLLEHADFFLGYSLGGPSKEDMRNSLSVSSLKIIKQVITYNTLTSVELIDREGFVLPGRRPDQDVAFFQLKKMGKNWEEICAEKQIVLHALNPDILDRFGTTLYAVAQVVVSS